MKKVWLLSALMAISTSFSAWSLTLSEAKAQGLIGERANGLLGMVVETQEAQQLVTEINGKRIAHYKKLAMENALTYEQVANQAGKKTRAKTLPGHYIENETGHWLKKE